MGIKIDWSDPNAADDYTVYRAAAPIPDGALPAALVTLPAGSLTYTDDTAVRNQLYYYRVASRKGTDVALTPNKALAYMPYTGPGPQALLRGDWNFGYFGKMPMSDLFSAQECKNYVGSITASSTENTAADLGWLKFVYKGKILFIASQALYNNLTWEQLYRAGVIYGNFPSADWAPYAKTTFGTIPQAKQVTRGDHSFIMRVPTSRAVMSSTGATAADQTGGEYDLILAYVFQNRFYAEALGIKTMDDLTNGSWITFSTDLQNNICINRGSGTQPDALNVSLGTNGVHVQHSWRPLFELVL
jgi:hypothetical protein